jgi:phosphatidylserine/phosphatidylglycerophosphate/cardiolipin synthase-like enzyme
MRLDEIAHDIVNGTSSSLFYSLAFLSQTPGPVREAIGAVTNNKQCFVYGISDREVGGLDVQLPNGNVAPVHPEALKKNAPAPFSEESAGGGGVRMHHKFIVIDFDKPTARVYLGSHNFSSAADKDNGENLLLIKDRRVATAYMVEALRLFDHYHFRITQANSATAKKELTLARPPKSGEKPWWHDDYNSPRKIMDRKLFA